MTRLCSKGHGYYTARHCPDCERQRDVRRGSRQQRGYDARHDRAKAALRKTLPAYCGYGCGTLLRPTDRWVAAHAVDGKPEFGWLASCPSCNERSKTPNRKVQSV